MTWNIDSSHSQITFSVRHMMISTVRGRFEELSGVVNFDQNNPENSSVDVKIDAASVSTRDEKRDGHLRSPDFFDAGEYPYVTFHSRRVERIGKSHGRIYGDLTIRNVTRTVTLDVEYNGLAKSPWGATSAGFSAKTTINRKDWGLNWNVALETGGVLVSDEIKIDIELEIVQQPEAEAEAALVA